MTAIEELGDLVRAVTAAAASGVVAIGRHGRGSGFVVAPGRVVTNAHNLRDETTEVRFADDRAVQGTVVGSDPDGDLVVLAVDTAGATPLVWSPDAVAPADVVVVLTAGRHRRRAAWGQVTATEAAFRGPRGRPVHGAIEHTAPCGAGSSGGPVLDPAGRVVGVNTLRAEHGFYLARAADADLVAAVSAMADGRQVERVRLGVAVAPPDVATRLRRSVGLEPRDGVLVRGVVDGSPAAAGGLREGDLLTRAGDEQLQTPDDLFRVLAGLAPGDQLTLGVVRGAEELTVTVTV